MNLLFATLFIFIFFPVSATTNFDDDIAQECPEWIVKSIDNSLEDFAANNVLIFSGINGLCNHLRALASSKVIADHLDRKLLVYWSHPNESATIAHAKWHDLFEYPQFDFIDSLPNIGILYGCKRPTDSSGIILTPTELCTLITNNKDLSDQYSFCTSPGAEFQINIPHNSKNVIIQTIHNIKPKDMPSELFLKKKREFYSTLIPVAYVRNKVNKISKQFSAHTVGVHIRGTDLLPFFGIDKAPYWKYLEAMEHELILNPKTTFYVSADSLETLMNIKNHFKDKVIINENLQFDKKLNTMRFSLKGQLDSLVDLFLLAKTSKLIITKYSSFSYEAVCIANVPYVEISYN